VQPTVMISHACCIAKSGKESVIVLMVRRHWDVAAALQQAACRERMSDNLWSQARVGICGDSI